MNEIEEIKKAAPEAEAPVAEEPATQPVQETEVPAENPAEAAEEGADQTPAAENPARQHPQTIEEVLERLRQLVTDNENAERSEIDALRVTYYRLVNARTAAAREAFVAGGGAAEDFRPEPEPTEEEFKANINLLKERRAQAVAAVEEEKQRNLERKLAIIEQIKNMVATPEEVDKSYDTFKQLQAEWKEIKLVPAEKSTELWKNYQLYVEQFYDLLRLNFEFRAYDFKKNLEIKTRLCEAAEKLAEVADPVSAFHQLQKLHQEFRETGPVAKEYRDEIWTRFKNASTLVNKRHQDHFISLKAKEEENLAAKTALCEKVEAIDLTTLKTMAQWDEVTKQVIEIQNEWKTIGFTPRKVNAQIFERFRTACDAFFRSKTAFFRGVRESLSANLAAKTALCEKAESLKDSTDWGSVTNTFVELQKEWKTIGPVPHKVSDAIWHRFNDACNYFFAQKQQANSGQRQEEEANLEKKNDIIARLEQLLADGSDNMLQAVRELQAEWNGVGHVPFRKKDRLYKRYREVCDKIYDGLHANAGRRSLENFRRNVSDKGGNELSRERQRLQNAYEAKKSEIQNYETNLTFLNAKSKSGNSLVEDIQRRIERLKDDLRLIAEKLAAVDDQNTTEQ